MKALNQVVLAGSLSGLLESVGQVILIKHRVASLKHCAEQLLALGKTVYDMKLRFGELGLLQTVEQSATVIFAHNHGHVNAFANVFAKGAVKLILLVAEFYPAIREPTGFELKASSRMVTPPGVCLMLRRCSTCSMRLTA